MTALSLDIGQLLHVPIDPDFIQFRPKSPHPKKKDERDGPWQCLAVAYYEVWNLVQILDTHVFGHWNVSAQNILYSEADARIIVSLVLNICGVSMAGVGEAFLDAETQNDERAVTEAWATAFKRACALFGLGLGIYFLPPLPGRFVPYSVSDKKITASADYLRNLAYDLYKHTPDPLLKGIVGCEGQGLASLETHLKAPFPPNQVDFLQRPGSRFQDDQKNWMCEANPYVEVWSLVRRLNAIAYGAWSVPKAEIALARNTVIVTVWLQIGETVQPASWQEPLTIRDRQSSRIKVADDVVTTTFSYAFKRAAQIQGLSLYLRFLPPLMAPFDTVRNKISVPPYKLAQQLYAIAGLLPDAKSAPSPVRPAQRQGAEPQASQLSTKEREEALQKILRTIAPDPRWVLDLCHEYKVDVLEALSDAQLGALRKRLVDAAQPGTATERQMISLRQLGQHFQEALPDKEATSYIAARLRISELSARYRESQQAEQSAHS